jgi:hypothetical protein
MDMRDRITTLEALARGAAAGATARARRRAAEAATSLARLAQGSPADCAALVADARVVPALAAAICSRHGAVAQEAMAAAGCLVAGCPAAARLPQQEALMRLGALEAAVEHLSAGGRRGSMAAYLVACVAGDGPEDAAGAAVAAGALPPLVALLGDADVSAASLAADAVSALVFAAGRAVPPIAAAAVDAGAVRALTELLGRGGLRAAALGIAIELLSGLAQTPAGAERLVTDGVLPHVVRLLRSPARGVADDAVLCLTAAAVSENWRAVAEALLADATAAPALVALLLRPDGEAPFRAALVLGGTMGQALGSGIPEASRQARDLTAAIRRAGAVPRLVELLRATLEEERRGGFAFSVLAAVASVCHVDADAAREALGAGAWPEACRAFLEEDAHADDADEGLLAQCLNLLAAIIRHSPDGAPCPAAAAEPGLVAALARFLGRAAARVPPGAQALLGADAGMAAKAVMILEAALAGSDGAQRAAEFVHAGGAGHLVSARQRSGRPGLGSWARGHGPCEDVGVCVRPLTNHSVCGREGETPPVGALPNVG